MVETWPFEQFVTFHEFFGIPSRMKSPGGEPFDPNQQLSRAFEVESTGSGETSHVTHVFMRQQQRELGEEVVFSRLRSH